MERLLPGGRDVDPRLYTDEPRHPRTDEPDEIQDAADIAAAGAVISVGLPTLAICRGFQVLNVALGGTLVQHLEPDPIDHANNELHEVDCSPARVSRRPWGRPLLRCRRTTTRPSRASARPGGRGPGGRRMCRGVRTRDGPGDGCSGTLRTTPRGPEQQALFDFVVEQAGVFRTQRMAT